MKKPRIILLNDMPIVLARAIAEACGGIIEGAQKRCSLADVTFDNVGVRLRELFNDGVPIIAVMASGAVIRLLAPQLSDKDNEPPVIVVSEDGAQVIPLLGGHHGANEMARKIASALNANAAISTAGDLRFGVALDQPAQGYVLANIEQARAVMGALVAGASVRLHGKAPWLEASALPFDEQGDVTLTVSEKPVIAKPLELVYHPKTYVLGMGCERGVSGEEAIELALRVLEKSGIAQHCIAAVCTIDVKSDETAIAQVGEYFGVSVRVFDAPTLERESARLKNPSDVVFAEVGCHGVAEGAALAGVGDSGELVIEKQKSKRVTAALARSTVPINSLEIGRGRGQLFVIGIGPGASDWRSPQASAMIEAATDLVGYSLYLDLVRELTTGKIRHDFDLGKEEDRVRHAMELAGEGKRVALICSGDAGIYAMATLVFELLNDGGLSASAKRIDIEIAPGISALQAAAARIGAPLGHDFCTISLSDLLTPWDDIKRRIKAAGEGDFVIAFYNPVSKKRRTQLAYARDELLKFRPADTPVILASNLGREKERVRVVALENLNIEDVDMLTVVVVGSSNTASIKTGDGRHWVYTPRGYSAKIGTGLKGGGR